MPTSPRPPASTVPFDGSRSADPDGTVVGYAWDFGDGATSKGAQVSHGFTAAGTYTVALTVTDDRGATGRATLTATVTDAPPPPPPPPVNQPPVAVLTGPATGLTGDTLTFDGTGSHDPDGQVVAWALDFGDGSTSATATATHAFAAPGTYTVTLTVTDDAGATGKATLDVAIADPPPVDYSGTWTWSLVDPSQANLGWACGTWQSRPCSSPPPPRTSASPSRPAARTRHLPGHPQRRRLRRGKHPAHHHPEDCRDLHLTDDVHRGLQDRPGPRHALRRPAGHRAEAVGSAARVGQACFFSRLSQVLPSGTLV